MSTARLGREREHRVAADMTKRGGWRKVMRASASKGSADLLMVSEEHGAALVQVGSKTKTLGPADRLRLITDARDCGALALLAIVIPRAPIRYWHVTPGVPSTWDEWVITDV